MTIGLFGYGKMGKTIDQLAQTQGIQVAWRLDVDNIATATPELLRQADAVIEFSRPEAAFDNVMRCLQAGVPVVSGTTGWLDRLPEAQAYAQVHNGALLWSSNFSVGVNLFFAINRYVAQLLRAHPDYFPTMTEVHHIHKLDAPSGTAVTLAEDVVAEVPHIAGWHLGTERTDNGHLSIEAIREGEVPGTHRMVWHSVIDDISLEHKAHSRAGFASGALLAARWIVGKRGVFSMREVLGL